MMIVNLQQFAPVIAILGISLTLLFQGFALGKGKDTIGTGALAFSGGVVLFLLGFAALFPPSKWTLVLIPVILGIGCVLFFALKREFKKALRKK